MHRPQTGNYWRKLTASSGASGFAISGRRLPLSRRLVNSRKLKAIIRISASVGAMPRSLCRPRRSRDCMRTISSWPPRLTAYSRARPRRERVVVALPIAPEEYGGNMMRALRTLVLVGLIAIAGWTPTCAAERVDLLLVLAADTSRSVDEKKFQLQRSGYAAAFSDSRVIEAIRSGPNRRIAVTLVEWSGPLSQKIVIDWMVISDDKTARLFGDHIVEASRAFADSTSISAGIDFAMTQLDRAAYQTSRRAIDVSGDGDNNSGRDVTAARDEAIAKDVTINGLVILTEAPLSLNPLHTNPLGGLANYYRNNVIGGPGAFVMVAENINSFGDIIVKKLIAAIAQAVHQQRARD